jgi:hypothetical protein
VTASETPVSPARFDNTVSYTISQDLTLVNDGTV